jgi:acyl carrier protein
MSNKVISFDDFKHLLADELQLDESEILPEASFIDDLMVDSIRLVELMLRLDQEGINIPLEAAWDVETVGDAYRLYEQQGD